MNIFDASKSYETWLTQHMPGRRLEAGDIQIKHDRMASAAFPFLRATFFRWMQHWDNVCEDWKKAPRPLAVGDLHIENFGTWRDLDGRLIWGVNDFDEAFPLPYSLDLVRLAVSANLGIREQHFEITPEDALDALLEGYEAALERKGWPFVLEEHHRWLRKIATSELREPAVFWKKIRKLEKASKRQVAMTGRVLKSCLPEKGLKPVFLKRTAGLGSLGRPRVVALAEWTGGLVCREAKALAPSACIWARETGSNSQHTGLIIQKAIRVRDPFYQVHGRWLVRRLAPHCSKIELGHLPERRDEIEIVRAMGAETANVHLGSMDAKSLLKDFGKRRRKDFIRTVEYMLDLTLEDWNAWVARYG